MVVISRWVGLGQNDLCGNGKIPPGSLCLRLLTSSILRVGLGGVLVWGGLVLWLREGYRGRLFSGMEEDSTPSEKRWIYFGLKLAYGESV